MSETVLVGLQAALVGLLKRAAAVTALVGQRIYDEVPADALFPYIALGEEQSLDDSADCIAGREISVLLHVWARPPGGRVVAKRILGAIEQAVLSDPIAVEGHEIAIVALGTPGAQVFRDRDGATAHGTIAFRFVTEATE